VILIGAAVTQTEVLGSAPLRELCPLIPEASALVTGSDYIAFVASRRKAAKIKQLLVKSGCDAAKVGAIRAPRGSIFVR
jgi:hypothetical protein